MTSEKFNSRLAKVLVWGAFLSVIALIWFGMEMLSEVPEELLEEEQQEKTSGDAVESISPSVVITPAL